MTPTPARSKAAADVVAAVRRRASISPSSLRTGLPTTPSFECGTPCATTAEFVLVDTGKGNTPPGALTPKSSPPPSPKPSGQGIQGRVHLPFTTIAFSDDAKTVTFDAADQTTALRFGLLSMHRRGGLDEKEQFLRIPINGQTSMPSARHGQRHDLRIIQILPPLLMNSSPHPRRKIKPKPRVKAGVPGGGAGVGGLAGVPAARRRMGVVVTVSNYNLFLRALPDDGPGADHSGGKEGDAYADAWNGRPNSKTLTAWQTDAGARQNLVYLLESSPPDGGPALESSRDYGQAGDKFTTYQLSLFDVASRKLIKPQVEPFEHEYGNAQLLHWSMDRSHVTWQQEDRGHQRMRLIEADTHTGTVRNLADEKTKTFIWTAHTEGPARYGFKIFTYLEKTDEVLHQSEKDGWRHLYLIDPKTGENKQVTKGPWIIRGISSVDEDKRQIWFAASGMYPDQDPYFINYGRVNFDGTGLVMLTDGNGNHAVTYSPDRKPILLTLTAAWTCRRSTSCARVSDGKLVCKLEESDITELTDRGFKTPEVFSAKGRDGVTDIWGLITRPANYDPNKKYPVLENIYNGPQDSYVPKSFSAGGGRGGGYGALGFIVVQCDAMGTANRSKAFHDVCWHNLGDGGFPDRIAWIKAAGAKHPEFDLDHVGIFGTSAGGQNAAAAVIFHPEFYKAAVANSGCHDNRLDKASWNEQWMGYMPFNKIWSKDPDNWYSKSSNIDNAAKLGAKLMLIVGEQDHNVPPESTFRLVDALINANKDFELVVVPNADHGAASPPTGSGLQVNRAFADAEDPGFSRAKSPWQIAAQPERRREQHGQRRELKSFSFKKHEIFRIKIVPMAGRRGRHRLIVDDLATGASPAAWRRRTIHFGSDERFYRTGNAGLQSRAGQGLANHRGLGPKRRPRL